MFGFKMSDKELEVSEMQRKDKDSEEELWKRVVLSEL